MRRSTVITIAGLLLLIALLLYTTLSGVEVECTVCIAYRGRTDCRVAAGPTREAAIDSATQMACAQLVSGRAEALECDRTPPTRSECREP